MSSYVYAQGNLLATPNKYFYSAYEGPEFIDAYVKARRDVLAVLPPPCVGAPDAVSNQSNPALESVFLIARQVRHGEPLPPLLEALLMRFEISKRVYEAYDDRMRPLDRERYHDLGNYARLGEAFDAAYERVADLRLLNALLKVGDILCAHSRELNSDLGSRVARLVDRELGHVATLNEREGLVRP